MSKTIQYSNESMGDLKLRPDFLLWPKQLVFKQQNTKVIISLSSESITYFKAGHLLQKNHKNCDAFGGG